MKSVLEQLDRRINILKEHAGPTKKVYENEYAELMDSVARVVGAALLKELEDLRERIVCAQKENCE